MSTRQLIEALFQKTEEISAGEISSEEKRELMEVAIQMFKLESRIMNLVGIHRHSW